MLELRSPRRRVRADRGVPERAGLLGPRRRRRRPLPRLPALGAAAPHDDARRRRSRAALPLAACRIRDGRPSAAAPANRSASATWSRTWDDDGYAAAIEAVRAAIGRGDVYQVNLVQHLSAPFAGDPAGARGGARAAAAAAPRPLAGDGWAIVSASPELFLARRGRRVWTMPIKGTRPAGEHVDGAKDAAEHMMIVDLERNDLARVCEPGSIRWPELLAERELAGVTHLVSTVEGTLRDGRRPCRAARGDLPRRLGHRRAEDRRARPDRRARAGRPRRVDGRARPSPAERRPRARADDPHVRGRRRARSTSGSAAASSGTPTREAEIEESWVKARPLLAALGARSVAAREAARGRGRRPRRRRSGRAVFAPATRRCCAAAPRSRRRASTAAGRSGSTRTSSGSPRRREPRAAGRPTAARARRLAATALDGRRRGRTRSCASTGRARRSVATRRRDPAELEDAARARAAARLAAARRRAERAAGCSPGVKSTSYAVNMAAEAEARRPRRRRRASSSRDGRLVLEAPITNIWWRRGDTLFTPSLELGMLAGVTRATLLELAAARRLPRRGGRASRSTRAARGRRGVHVVVDPRGAAGRRARRRADRRGAGGRRALQRALCRQR